MFFIFGLEKFKKECRCPERWYNHTIVRNNQVYTLYTMNQIMYN